MYSVGQIFILKVSSLKNTFWSALSMDVFGVGFVFLVAAVFYVMF